MNMFETLMTRDEHNSPILDLAAAMTESADHLSYSFTLRQGVHFHNGKTMTSADVLGSFERYRRISLDRSIFNNVASWDTPDSDSFVIHLKQPQPTFIEALSSFATPIVIVPLEDRDDPPMQLKTIGTGPFELAEYVPGSYVKLKRFDGYVPNPAFSERTGFGGYKQACFDTVTFRIVTEPGARVAGLQTGELQGVEDVPTKSVEELKRNPAIVISPLPNWWIHIASPNISAPPTDNLAFRRAVQAVLDMDEIMDASTDGNYSLNVGFQYPDQAGYVDAGRETYNIRDPARARQYLKESGYGGEPVVLLTNKDYASMYNAALVMAEQLKSIGINAVIKVVDWPTSVQIWQKHEGWNFFFSGWGTPPALGPLAVMQFMVGGVNASYRPPGDHDDPDLLAAYNDMNTLPTAEERKQAFSRAQALILDRVYAIPFGSLTKVQAVRATVRGYVPFRIPRMFNVWFAN
jgi:peptide/nickel transport system substrate-binding protein